MAAILGDPSGRVVLLPQEPSVKAITAETRKQQNNLDDIVMNYSYKYIINNRVKQK